LEFTWKEWNLVGLLLQKVSFADSEEFPLGLLSERKHTDHTQGLVGMFKFAFADHSRTVLFLVLTPQGLSVHLRVRVFIRELHPCFLQIHPSQTSEAEKSRRVDYNLFKLSLFCSILFYFSTTWLSALFLQGHLLYRICVSFAP
jgi:hypothetical protein